MEIKNDSPEKLEFQFQTSHGKWNCAVRDRTMTDDRLVAEDLNCEHMEDPDRELSITNADVVKLADKTASVEQRGNNTTVVDSRNIDDVDTSNKFRDGISARFE